jgi:hypothetical protein
VPIFTLFESDRIHPRSRSRFGTRYSVVCIEINHPSSLLMLVHKAPVDPGNNYFACHKFEATVCEMAQLVTAVGFVAEPGNL